MGMWKKKNTISVVEIAEIKEGYNHMAMEVLNNNGYVKYEREEHSH